MFVKILLVDDEDFIRQGIRYTIPWEENDLEVYEASNGKEALDLALHIKPEIVLTDIQMPVMGGIELARSLAVALPETRVIILTAFGNTENLMNAIDVQVSGFLVKNADSNKILDMVLKVKRELDLHKANSVSLNQMKGIYNENKGLIKSTLLSRFLNRQISFAHFSRKGIELGMDLRSLPLALVVVKFDSANESIVIGKFLQCFREYCPLCFCTQNRTVVTLLSTERKELDAAALDRLVPSVSPFVFGNFITAMNGIRSYEELPTAYMVLQQALEHCFWNSEKNYILLPSQTQISPASTPPVPYAYEKRIMKGFISQKPEEISAAISAYYMYMKGQTASRSVFLDSVLRILVLISSVSEEEIDIEKMNVLIHETETPEGILNLVESLLNPIPRDSVSHSQITNALNYMQAHFAENIYLEDVAKASYLSSGYLCRIFKAETGYSFKEYLHKLRIEKAQELIRDTEYKYYEIAEMVGYKNYKYFSSYFSKITGCTAKEYRISGFSSSTPNPSG